MSRKRNKNQKIRQNRGQASSKTLHGVDSEKSVVTVRLPVSAVSSYRRYADRIGVSFNSLVAVALHDYVKDRT